MTNPIEWSVFSLWMPIVGSGFATHFASTLAWTVLPHHKPEIKSLGDKEEQFTDWIACKEIEPGQYVFPYCEDMKQTETELFKQKQGKCSGELRVWARPVNMLAAMVKTLGFFLFAAFMIGYVCAYTLTPYTDKGDVFRIVLVLGIMTHCFAIFPRVFWFPRSYATSLVDGVVYALLTAGIFYALWPTVVMVKSFE